MKTCTRFWFFGYILVAICTLTGCKGTRQIVERPVSIHDTLWQQYYSIDTVYTDHWHYIDRKGDTVWMVDSVIVYRAKYIHDTIREVQEIPVIKTEVKEVEKPLKWYQKTLMYAGAFALLIGIGWLMLRLYQSKPRL